MQNRTSPSLPARLRSVLRPVVVLAVSLAAASCTSAATEPDDSEGSVPSSGGGDLTTVQIVEIPGLAQMLYPHIADAEGYFEEHGLDPEFISAASGPALVTSILGGNAQLGMAGPQLIWPAMQQGEDIVTLASAAKLNYLIVSCDADVPTPNAEAPFPENLQDLEGMRLGTIAEGTQTERFGLELVKAAGLEPGTDVEILYVGAAGTAIPACDAGRLDFYTFNPPAQARLGAEGEDYTVLADALAPSSGGIFEGLISDVYTTTRSFADENPEVVDGFCRAVLDAKEFATDPANIDQVTAYLAEFTDIPEEEARAIWEGGLPDSLLSPIDQDTWARQADAQGEELSSYVPDYDQHVHSGCTDLIAGSE